MMDESPLGVIDFGNNMAETDNNIAEMDNNIAETDNNIAEIDNNIEETDNNIEETDNTTFIHDWINRYEEKQLETIENRWQSFIKEEKELGSPFVLAPAEDNKPYGEMPSPAKERIGNFTLPPPLYFKPYIRKRVRQAEIVFNRECKKLEQVWTYRGLPVDRETVCSVASKDAFDLKDLSESLPSTSTSGNKPSTVEIESPSSAREFEQIHRRLANGVWISNHVSPTFNHPRNLTHSCRATIRRLSETVPPACNSEMETAQKGKLTSLVMAQQYIHLKRLYHSCKKNFHPLLYSEKPDCDEQKEASEDSLHSILRKVLSNSTHTCQKLSQKPRSSPSEQPNFGEEFAKMSIDDKQDEKKKETQDSDDENCLLSPVLNPLPLMTPYVPKFEISSWDSDKHWNLKFDYVPKKLYQVEQEFYQLNQEPATVPLNSPIKMEENAVKKDLVSSMELAEMRLNALKYVREQKKLKTLNSFRRIFPGDEDDSESEKPSLEEVSRVFNQKGSKKDSGTQTDISIDKLKENSKKGRQILREMKESLKNIRTICPIARRRHHIVKSDKVVPD